MRIEETALPGVLVVETAVLADERGHFREVWRADSYEGAGVPSRFLQDNAAYSRRGVLRGLHYQHPHPQGKLVGVVTGEVFDVAVDLRRSSPHFGRWTGHVLSGENGRQLWIPPGFAHGYLTLSQSAVFVYKCTEYYHAPSDRAVAWNDATLSIAWPTEQPILSRKDAAAPALADLDPDLLPRV
jgi:dTDP-4-dehydrorhamnose 3,5-epimerase